MEKVDEATSLEFKWLKKRGVGKKKGLQFYESFIYDGVQYTLYDCVYMYKEGVPQPYIGKLVKIYEHLDKSQKAKKVVKVHWFFRPEEISKWLGDTKTLENEILLASGEGVGLANISPLEAIAGQCNVVCLSKDRRNPQPSDEERKVAEYVFYRTFDVQSCTILDKMDDKIGGLEIKYIFNRKEDENTSTFSQGTADRKEENKNTATCSESQQLLMESTSNKLKDDGENDTLTVKVDANKMDETYSEMGKTDSRIIKADKDNTKLKDNMELKDMPFNKDEADKGEAKRNKTPMGLDMLHDRPLKKIKSNGNITPKDKQVDSSISLPVDSKLKHEEKSPLHVNNPKALETPGTSEEKPNGKNGKVLLRPDKGKIVMGDSDDKILKKAKVENSFKVPDSKKNDSVQKLSINNNGSNGKDVVVTSGESKRKLSMSKSLKASALSTDEDKKSAYQEFVVGPKRNADKSSWFRLLPWEQRLKEAYDQGAAILLHNVDPDYTSREIEDIVWHALGENCEAKILPRTAVSSPHCGQALILFKMKEAAQRVLTRLDAECLMLPNGRPLVGTACPPISSRKNSKFLGHLAIDKIKLQNQRELDEAVSTSHFSQPNTIEYDMSMEWFLLQSRSKKWWRMMHEQQGNEVKKIEAILKRKGA